MAVYVGSARIDENGRAYGGKAGDQTGKEVSRQKYYVHAKGWRVFRPKDRAAALKIAQAMEAACANANVGYDQWNRNTLYTHAGTVGFDISKVAKKCETDCSALVRVCCAFAGIMGLPANFRTGNMPANLLATGAFTELKGDKYTKGSAHLGKGDILVTKTAGHTVVVLTDGAKFVPEPAEEVFELGQRLLKNGAEGPDVMQLQEYLIGLGYDVGRWGVSGIYDDGTEMAVMAFQKDAKVEADGDYGPITHAALMAAVDSAAETPPDSAQSVAIVGGDCWIRTGPGTSSAKLGVAKDASRLPFAGEISNAGWLKVVHARGDGWVSGRYGRLE
ncbi:MAG: hypothetical protein E7337_10985 [Clostridiales bacterium]|nr:hypothetical protein [Clostridiales bacterium]